MMDGNWRENENGQKNVMSLDQMEIVTSTKEGLFDKKFKLPKTLKKENLALFQTNNWEVVELQYQKERLNQVRNLLDQKDINQWKTLTKMTNMCGEIVGNLKKINGIEMCTNAWAKMVEIYNNYDILPKNLHRLQNIKTMHICEAPGAFVNATNYYLQQIYPKYDVPYWNWLASSYNPSSDEGQQYGGHFILKTKDHWHFGSDGTGDLLKKQNIQSLWQKSGKVHLVTGDGSMDCMNNPNEQEMMVSSLHYAEMVCALGALNIGGSIVIKMFNLFECHSVALLYYISMHFEELNLFKPATSRAPNAEIYLIAMSFKGISIESLDSLLSFVSPNLLSGKVLLSREDIDVNFIEALIQASSLFTNHQINAIERNLKLEKNWNENIRKAVLQLNTAIVPLFKAKCHINDDQQEYWRFLK